MYRNKIAAAAALAEIARICAPYRVMAIMLSNLRRLALRASAARIDCNYSVVVRNDAAAAYEADDITAAHSIGDTHQARRASGEPGRLPGLPVTCVLAAITSLELEQKHRSRKLFSAMKRGGFIHPRYIK